MLLLQTRLFLIASSSLVQGHADKVKITAPSIAKRYNINSRALMPALRRLTQVGILKSQVGGSNPGFIFTRKPSRISMYEIITALEGEFKILSCRDIMDDVKCEICNCDDCSVFQIINGGILKTINDLKNTSLSDHTNLRYINTQDSISKSI